MKHSFIRLSIKAVCIGACSVQFLVACSPSQPKIPFAPYDKSYQSKPDLASVEHKYPLSVSDLNSLTPENLNTFDQEQIDQIYARLSAGPIPDGAFDGGIIFPKGTSGKARISEIMKGTTPGFALALKGLLTEKSVAAVDKLGELLWKGKVFYRDERLLRNRIDSIDTLKVLGLVEGEPKRHITVNGHESALLFPAKLFCGQSLLDSRRESVIIDYAFSEEIADYQEKPDFLGGRRGLKVRDEIRMVRPGFYLGRAYLDRVFLLNFTLYNKETAERDSPAFNKTGTVNEDCWAGTQVHHIAT
jgi:hypothetical protein